MLGGYQVIDFNGENLATAKTIKGAFKKAKSGKPLLVENLGGTSFFTNDVAHTDTTAAECPYMIKASAGHYEFVVLTITSADSCSIVTPE